MANHTFYFTVDMAISIKNLSTSDTFPSQLCGPWAISARMNTSRAAKKKKEKKRKKKRSSCMVITTHQKTISRQRELSTELFPLFWNISQRLCLDPRHLLLFVHVFKRFIRRDAFFFFSSGSKGIRGGRERGNVGGWGWELFPLVNENLRGRPGLESN